MNAPPQKAFNELELVTQHIAAGKLWFRCTRKDRAERPLTTYHSNARWNSPGRLTTPAYSGTYIAETFEGMWLETAGRKASTAQAIYDPIADRQRWVVEASNLRPLHVIDLSAHGMARSGLNKALAGGHDYRVTQEFGLLFYRHPVQPDGILYRCRANEALLSLFIFDRYQGGWSVLANDGMKGARYFEEYERCIDRYRMGPAPS